MSIAESNDERALQNHGPLILERDSLPTDGRRSRTLTNRRQHEIRMYHVHKMSWFRACIDPGMILRLGLAITGLRGWAANNAMSHRHRHLVFEYDDLPPAFDGLRILHLTDLHINCHPELADHIHDQIKDLEVDVCLLTGDYLYRVGEGEEEAHSYMERVLSGVNALGGTIGILGNHDTTANVTFLESLGVRMLLNESVEVQKGDQSIWVAGVDDPHDYRNDDLPAADHDIPEDAFKILLAHSPEIYEEAAELGYHLYLCGHTHAGQVQIPGIGPLISKSRTPRQFTHGTWKHNDLYGYTSSGIGASGLFARMFCPPEIGLIELHRKGND